MPYVPPGHMVEVTSRTIQGRYLLKPSPELRKIFIGVLAYAQQRHPGPAPAMQSSA